MEERNENITITEQEARDFLIKYRDSGKSQTDIAKELGISAAMLSGFLSGKYEKTKTIRERVQALMEAHEKKKVAPKKPGYVMTSISKEVLNAIKHCKINKTVSIVYGDAGVGKTMAYKAYLKDDPMAVGFTAMPVYANIAGVNRLIARKLNIAGRGAIEITESILGKLEGSDRVIIIDEAQHLTIKAINHLRCISDAADIGICLIGNTEIYAKIKQARRDEDNAQIYSRFGMRRELSTADIKKADVQAVFGDYGIDDEAMEMLYRICQTKYGMRGAANVFVNTVAVFQELTASGIGQVMRDLNIGA